MPARARRAWIRVHRVHSERADASLSFTAAPAPRPVPIPRRPPSLLLLRLHFPPPPSNPPPSATFVTLLRPFPSSPFSIGFLRHSTPPSTPSLLLLRPHLRPPCYSLDPSSVLLPRPLLPSSSCPTYNPSRWRSSHTSCSSPTHLLARNVVSATSSFARPPLSVIAGRPSLKDDCGWRSS